MGTLAGMFDEQTLSISARSSPLSRRSGPVVSSIFFGSLSENPFLNIEMNDRFFDFRSAPGGVTQRPIPVTGTARLFNGGGSEANVTAWCCHVFPLQVLPMKLPFESPEVEPDPPVNLPPGRFGTIPFPSSPRDPITISELYDLGRGALGIYVMGIVVYRDAFGNNRTTSFCREWRYGWPGFKAVDNSDYEDAD
jgi:hypothetical protein